MPNLVGIGLSQVPTNSMLGGLAYQDPEHASIKNLDLKNLSQINSEIADTATDVFVYDTSKDSDGGAWRKRTQNTSWYNETLNTSARGSRKEFPAVAVIVVEDNGLTIYDGDDPDLSMWMKWTSTTMLRGATSRKLAVKNGIIALSGVGTYTGLIVIYFISDTARSYRAIGSNNNSEGFWKGNIAGRNDYSSNNYSNGSGGNVLPAIVSENIKDVAITVLPNAPVDSATGLPVPTIAVGTNSGVSIINDDDGTVVDYVHQSGAYDVTSFIQFLSDNRVAYGWDSDNTPRRLFITPIRSADTTTVNTSSYPIDSVGTVGYGRETDNKDVGNYHGHLIGEDQSVAASMNESMLAVGDGSAGLNLIDVQAAGVDVFDSRIAFITKDYNTGWQHGNIKGTFLSDTDTTNITSGEILTNGDFTNGTTGWTIQDAGEGSISESSNQLTLNNSTTADPPVACYQQISLEVGKYYNVKSNRASGLQLVINITTGTSNGGGSGGYGNVIHHSSNGEVNATFLATNATMYCYIRVNTNSTGTVVMNSVSIRKAEADRSVNNAFSRDKSSALTINGTVTKTAVATGAELVAYSGFSNSNYFEQPFSSAMQFGSTGDFSIAFWMKQTSPAAFCGIIDTGYASNGNYYFMVATDGNGKLFFRQSDNTGQSDKTSNNTVTGGEWKHIVCTRTGNGTQMNTFIDGVLDSNSGSATAKNITNVLGEPLIIGNRGNSTDRFFTGSLALARVSASAPSAEQVKKMYEDEKCLFHENAKATLYGSSDAVTALAYDEVTDQLHVGTSAGRSDFQGLRRINNTTTAVTTAISAHDEFIIEQ